MSEDSSEEIRRFTELSFNSGINFTVTDEGVIIDTFHGDACTGTMGMTYDEWFYYVERRMNVTNVTE